MLTLFLLCIFASVRSDWSYDNQTDWPGSCANEYQSPINLSLPSNFSNRSDVKFTYSSQPIILFRTNHTVGMNISQSGFVTVNHTGYMLDALYFHNHSEHRISSRGYHDFEVHLTHSASDGRKLVISTLCTVSDSSSWFNKLIGPFNQLSTLNTDHLVIGMDISLDEYYKEVLGSFREYWSYDGSMTSPPCAPTKWYVNEGTCTIPRGLKTILLDFPQLANNYRHIQSLEGRIIRTSDEFVPSTTTSTSTSTTTSTTTTRPRNTTTSTTTPRNITTPAPRNTTPPHPPPLTTASPKNDEHSDTATILVTVVIVILLIIAGTWWYCYAQNAVRIQTSSEAESRASVQEKKTAPLLNGNYVLSGDQIRNQFDGITPVGDAYEEEDVDVFRVYPPGGSDDEHYY